jgi:hypothetical protein
VVRWGPTLQRTIAEGEAGDESSAQRCHEHKRDRRAKGGERSVQKRRSRAEGEERKREMSESHENAEKREGKARQGSLGTKHRH